MVAGIDDSIDNYIRSVVIVAVVHAVRTLLNNVISNHISKVTQTYSGSSTDVSQLLNASGFSINIVKHSTHLYRYR